MMVDAVHTIEVTRLLTHTAVIKEKIVIFVCSVPSRYTDTCVLIFEDSLHANARTCVHVHCIHIYTRMLAHASGVYLHLSLYVCQELNFIINRELIPMCHISS